MNLQRPIYTPPEGPPLNLRLDPSIYSTMGKENIFQMLEDFYAELEKTSLRPLFPKDMKEASKKSGAFFVFLLGGPPLYHEKYGPPMMRKRHLPFVIDENARNIWIESFKKILEKATEKYNFPAEHIESFLLFLDKFSRWMVNTET